MLGETLYGLAGGLYKGSPSTIRGFSFGLGAVGFLLTFLYDLSTNVVSGLTAGIPVVVALATGAPFTLVCCLGADRRDTGSGGPGNGGSLHTGPHREQLPPIRIRIPPPQPVYKECDEP